MWRESGGPPVAEPSRSGFGSRMIRTAFANEPGGRAELTFAPDGVTCVLAAGLIDEAQAPTAPTARSPASPRPAE